MLVHLWTDGPMPGDYLELVLCRDVYHCPPQQLPPVSQILRHLVCLDVEAKVREMRSKPHGR